MLLEITTLYKGVIYNPVFFLYVAVLLVDLITGNIKAFIVKEWTSKVGLNGTLRHFAIFSLVLIMLPAITFYTGNNVVSTGVVMYIIIQYTMSILENMTYFGLDLTDSLTKFFPQMRGHTKKDEEEK